MSSAVLIAKFQKEKHPKTEHIIATNRLKSGDLLLQVATVEAKEALERSAEWATQAYPSAILVQKAYGVMVHGMRISAFDTNDQKAIKEKIEKDNQELHPGLNIVRTRWIGSASRPTKDGKEKRYSSLIVYTATAGMADGLIQRQLIEFHEIKSVSKYDQGAELMQCFNCQGYSHMTMRYSNKTRCGKCSLEHNIRDHNDVDNAPDACAACNQQGHPAWSSTCSIRKKELNKAYQRLANKAPLYGSSGTLLSGSDSSSPPRSFESFLAQSYPSSPPRSYDGSGINENARKRKVGDPQTQIQDSISTSSGLRRKVGRPRKLEAPEQGQGPLILLRLSLEPQFQFG